MNEIRSLREDEAFLLTGSERKASEGAAVLRFDLEFPMSG
jgi:hypothetical protein